MEKKFWHEKWEANEIGFHQETIHPMLQKYWPQLNLPAGSRVFVPLCGKSKDMLWLRQAGHSVYGVELSEIGVQSFFKENGLSYSVKPSKPFTHYQSDNIELLCGDFFALNHEVIGTYDAIFDRAALVAMPPEMRNNYIGQIKTLTQTGILILLITIEYETGMINPPPFVVTEDEVLQLYGDWCDITLLGEGQTRIKNLPCLERAHLVKVTG